MITDLISKLFEGLVWRATWYALDDCQDNEAPAGTCVCVLNDLSDRGWSWVHRPYHDFKPMCLPSLAELVPALYGPDGHYAKAESGHECTSVCFEERSAP